jgi:hypothetical protein
MVKGFENRKGMFFTLSTYFLVTALLTMAFITTIRPNFEENFVLDRIHDLSVSVEKSIREIFSFYYDVNITIEKYNADGTLNVTFTEKISRERDDWGEEFSRKIENFKNFVESEDENVKINLSEMEEKELPLVIEPHNITYSRFWGIGHVVLNVNPQTLNFNSYDIMVNSGSEEIDKVTSQLRGAGSFLFRVVARDDYGNTFIEEKFVDPYDKHQVQIFFVDGNKMKVDLDETDLEMWTNTETELIVTTKVDSLVKMNEKIKIKLFQDAINVSFPEFGVEKVSSINIEEE